MGLLSFFGGLLGLGGSPARNIDIQKVSAASGLKVIYGTRRVEPISVFKVISRNNMPRTSGVYDHVFDADPTDKREEVRDNNDWLHRIDVWGQGEISAISRFWIDGDAHTATRFKTKPYIRVLSKYGSDSQAAATELATGHSDWTSNHKGLGVAYTWVRFFNYGSKPQYDAEPQLSAQIKGLRVYDPREVTHSFSDPSTWVYSNNRALIVLNYLMSSFGFNAPLEDLDIASFIGAANKCDEQMDIPPVLINQTGVTIPNHWNWLIGDFEDILDGYPFTGYRPDQAAAITQAKFAVDAVLDPKDGVIKNTKYLLEGMGWSLPWSNGQHKLIIEDVITSTVMTFDENSILGGWTIERGMRGDRLNRVTVEFPNSNKDYKDDTVSWPSISSQTYLDYKAEDNGQDLHTNQAVKTVTDFYRAQAYAEYLVRKSRVKTKITGLRLAPKAMLLEPGDVISIYYPEKGFGIDAGFDGTLFIVEKVDVSAFLDVRVDLTRYDPTVYGAPVLEQEPLANSPYNPDWWRDPPAVINPLITPAYETNADGSIIRVLDVTWQLPVDLIGIISVEVAWKKQAAAEYTDSILLDGSSSAAKITGVTNDNVSYDVRIIYKTRRGQESLPVVLPISLTNIASKLDLIEDGADNTADHQFAAAIVWDIGGTSQGWTAVNATLALSSYGMTVTPTTVDHQLISPDNLNIDGGRNGTVMMRVKRVAGNTLEKENIKLYFQTVADPTWSESKTLLLSRRLNTGAWTTAVFDLTATSAWTSDTIKRIRLDITEQSDDVFEVDWISVGRSAVANLTNNVNLLDRLSHVVLGLADQDLDGQFDDIILDEMGLKAGDVVSASIEVLAGGARGGKLSIYFVSDGDVTPGPVQKYAPNWISNSGLQYVTSKIENIVIPDMAEGVTITKIRLRLSRQDAVAGLVGARRPMLNRGPTVEPWNIARADVAADATHNTGVLADLDEVTNAELALLSATWKTGGSSGTMNFIDGESLSIGALIYRDFATGAEIQLLWNPVAKTNVGTSEQINVKFYREDMPGSGPRIEIESFTFFLSNTRKNVPIVLLWTPASIAEIQNTHSIGIELSIVDGTGNVTFEPARFAISEDTA